MLLAGEDSPEDALQQLRFEIKEQANLDRMKVMLEIEVILECHQEGIAPCGDAKLYRHLAILSRASSRLAIERPFSLLTRQSLDTLTRRF